MESLTWAEKKYFEIYCYDNFRCAPKPVKRMVPYRCTRVNTDGCFLFKAKSVKFKNVFYIISTIRASLDITPRFAIRLSVLRIPEKSYAIDHTFFK